MTETKYLIPFSELRDTIGAFNSDKWKAHMNAEFNFTICGVKLHVARYDLGCASESMATALLSDCAMELLAHLVKAELELYPFISQMCRDAKSGHPMSESQKGDLEDALLKEEEKLLINHFGVRYDRDLDKQKVPVNAVCYDGISGKYGNFVCNIPKDYKNAHDGKNAIVDLDGQLAMTRLVDLVVNY